MNSPARLSPRWSSHRVESKGSAQGRTGDFRRRRPPALNTGLGEELSPAVFRYSTRYLHRSHIRQMGVPIALAGTCIDPSITVIHLSDVLNECGRTDNRPDERPRVNRIARYGTPRPPPEAASDTAQMSGARRSQTSPMPPTPSSERISYGPRRAPVVSGMGLGSTFFHWRWGPPASARCTAPSFGGLAVALAKAGTPARTDSDASPRISSSSARHGRRRSCRHCQSGRRYRKSRVALRSSAAWATGADVRQQREGSHVHEEIAPRETALGNPRAECQIAS